MENNFILFDGKHYTDFKSLLKNFRKKEGEEKIESFYNETIYPTKLCPRCLVTSNKLKYFTYKAYGLRCGSLVKNLYKKHKDIEKCLEELKKLNAFFIEELNGYFHSWGDTSSSCKTKNKKELIYNKYFFNKTKCCLDGCNKKVPLEYANKNACSTLHYNRKQMLKNNRYSEKDLKYACVLDGEKFPSLNHLSKHIKKLGWDLKDYYNQHINQKDEKCCKWCQKPTKFKSLKTGYLKFCYNTNCNVLWYNKHTQRHLNGEKISESLKRNQNMTSQLGYWLKKGYSEKEAKKKLSERQTTNSIKAIQKRHNCSKEEAIQIRQEITKKWIDSFETLPYSKVSQELFWSIYEKIKDRVKIEDVFFATFNKGEKDNSGKTWEYKIKTKTSYKRLDFFIKTINKCIEFDGAYWHGNRNRRGKKYDLERDEQIIEAMECSILHIPEMNYYQNKEKVINDCIKFLFSETENKL